MKALGVKLKAELSSKISSVLWSAWVLFSVASLLFFTYGPLIHSLFQSFQKNGQPSFEAYRLIFQTSDLGKAFLRSCLLAATVALTATMLSFLAIIPAHRSPNFWAYRWNQSLSYPLLGAPDLLLAIAWLVWLTKLHIPLGFPCLWIAHTTICFPFSIRIFKSQFSRLNPVIFEAARDLGAKGSTIVFRLLIPLLKPAIYASMGIGFLFSMEDLVVSEFLTSPRFQTLPLFLENRLRLGPSTVNHALSVLLSLMIPLLSILTLIGVKSLFQGLRALQPSPHENGRHPLSLSVGRASILFLLVLSGFEGLRRGLASIKSWKPPLTIYALPGYLTPEIINRFSSQTGLKVNVHLFHSTEEMISRLSFYPAAPCDLILASGNQLAGFQRLGQIRALGPESQSCFQKIDTFFLNNPYDPRHQYFIPYVWGLTGIAVQADHPEAQKPTRWKQLWSLPLQDTLLCIDDAKELIALIDLQFSSNLLEPVPLNRQWTQAAAQLIQKASILAQENLQDYFTLKEARVGMIWSGAYLKAEAEGAKLRFIWPEEGALLWVDGFYLPANTKKSEEALRFIQHCFLEEEVQKSVLETRFAPVHFEGPKLLAFLHLDQNPLLNSEIQLKKSLFHWVPGEDNAVFQAKIQALQWIKFGILPTPSFENSTT